MNNAGWKTIDTAPRDGTPCLCYVPGDHFKYQGNQAVLKYIDDDFSFWSLPGFGGFQPTHWMPIPEGPSRERLE